MLSPKAQYHVGDAKKYFREHLRVGDYYTEGQHVPGHWYGKGAEDLGLSGVTTEDEFVRLCDNRVPFATLCDARSQHAVALTA